MNVDDLLISFSFLVFPPPKNEFFFRSKKKFLFFFSVVYFHALSVLCEINIKNLPEKKLNVVSPAVWLNMISLFCVTLIVITHKTPLRMDSTINFSLHEKWFAQIVTLHLKYIKKQVFNEVFKFCQNIFTYFSFQTQHFSHFPFVSFIFCFSGCWFLWLSLFFCS